MKRSLPILRGRGAATDPPSRFQRLHVELGEEFSEEEVERPTQYFRDAARTALTRNDSPDVPFEWSLNPYRGCAHGCSYCYARPTHEYLGFSAGLDFETKIMVKEDAPELLREALAKPTWRPVPIAMSGVTDPYQPVERKLGITRRCLEVFAETGHPVSIVTKGSAVVRDTDLLSSLARRKAAQVTISVTTLDRALQRAMEPRAAPPEHRLEAIRSLSEAGIPVGVSVAPVIPGLTDHEIPSILRASRDAGATSAAMFALRLPGAVEGIFLSWLRDYVPNRYDRVLGRLRELHGGRLSDPRFGHRMRGQGPYADHLRRLFHVSVGRVGLTKRSRYLSTDAFRRPTSPTRSDPAQLDLLAD